MSAWPAFSHTALTTTLPPSGQSPGCLPICHPGLAAQPSPEGLTCRVGQQWPQGQHASPLRGQSSHLLSLLPIPQGLSRLQMRSSHLDPKESRRLCKAPLPSQLKSKDSGHSSGARETHSLHLFTDKDTEA